MGLKRREKQHSEVSGSSAYCNEAIPSVQQVVLLHELRVLRRADREHCEGFSMRGTDLLRNELRMSCGTKASMPPA
jgi:hypothetical protein